MSNIIDTIKNKNGSQLLLINSDDLVGFANLIIKRYKEEVEENNNREILTKKEVQELLQVTSQTLIDWNKSGYLRHVKVGKNVRYRKIDIDALINKRK